MLVSPILKMQIHISCFAELFLTYAKDKKGDVALSLLVEENLMNKVIVLIISRRV